MTDCEWRKWEHGRKKNTSHVGLYAKQFAKSMKGKWDHLVYIDLFAGPGRVCIRGTNRIVQSSPLMVMALDTKFDTYIFCDAASEKLKALEERVVLNYAGLTTHFLHGDSNELVDIIFSKIPAYGPNYKVLTFCFADPYKLDNLRFSTIKRLSERFMDFLILIPTGYDANRNFERYYLNPNNVKIQEFLGMDNWREGWEKAKLRGENFDLFLTNAYGENMKALKYKYDGIEKTVQVRSSEKNLNLYRLAFFSRNPVGLKLWKEAKKYSDPQESFKF
jgi:three-Cys-motif partner protein